MFSKQPQNLWCIKKKQLFFMQLQGPAGLGLAPSCICGSVGPVTCLRVGSPPHLFCFLPGSRKAQASPPHSDVVEAHEHKQDTQAVAHCLFYLILLPPNGSHV